MKIRHRLFPTIALFAGVTVAVAGAWLFLHNTAGAQNGLPAPGNVQVTMGDDPTEVMVSWDAVAGAAGYSIRSLDLVASRRAHDAGQDWQNLIEHTDISDGAATSHTLKVDPPAINHGFAVGSRADADGPPNWSGWARLDVPAPQPVAAGAMTDAMAGESDSVAVLAAALAITRLSGELAVIGSEPTHGGMNRQSIVAARLALASHKSALAEQVDILGEKSHGHHAEHIGELVAQLVANVEAIEQGRPQLLRALISENMNRAQLTSDNTSTLFPGTVNSQDSQFYELMNKAGGVSSETGEVSQDDILAYANTTSLAANAGLAHTLLLVASLMQDPTYVARIHESHDSLSETIGRDIEYLASRDIPSLGPDVLDLARNVIEAGSGDDNYFDRLVARLELVVAERALIENNVKIMAKLMAEIDGLAAEAQGMEAPESGMMMMDGDYGTPGVFDTEILFGQSAALTGPSAALGTGVQTGIEAAFKEANDAGGVHGRQLTLTSRDDHYESDAAFAQTRALIENDQVFALIGAVGTPTSRAAFPAAHAAGVPFVGPLTGAQFLRTGESDNVLNVRASYHQETRKMVDVLAEAGVSRVAVLYQNDSYGVDGLTGVQAALEGQENMDLVASWYYRRNTEAVKGASFRIATADPEAVIIIGAYEPAARAIETLRAKLGTDTIFMAVSFVGSNALAAELGDAGEGVYVTQVVPWPSDGSVAVVANYLEALSAYDADAEPGFVSLEGYLVGRLVVSRLQECGATVSRECFLDVFDSPTSIDIDGLQLQYGPADNQGSDDVHLTVINAGGGFDRVDRID